MYGSHSHHTEAQTEQIIWQVSFFLEKLLTIDKIIFLCCKVDSNKCRQVDKSVQWIKHDQRSTVKMKSPQHAFTKAH